MNDRRLVNNRWATGRGQVGQSAELDLTGGSFNSPSSRESSRGAIKRCPLRCEGQVADSKHKDTPHERSPAVEERMNEMDGTTPRGSRNGVLNEQKSKLEVTDSSRLSLALLPR